MEGKVKWLTAALIAVVAVLHVGVGLPLDLLGGLLAVAGQ